VLRFGVVSFLNARPLIDGLEQRGDVQCVFDVPAALGARLEAGAVDVALLPVVDVLRAGGRYRVVSDACIGCDGETMTVRVFSAAPPNALRALRVDPDSHTSVALATILWRLLFDIRLEVRPLTSLPPAPAADEGVLLIGDKVVDPGRDGFGYEVDLGGAWRHHTGLPFTFAVWACRADADVGEAAELLRAARDRGVARAAEIAVQDGPAHGWTAALAQRYLVRCLRFTLDARAVAGVERFAGLCAEADLVPADATIAWPAGLCEPRVGQAS
jgi:chorismate dehydratase